MIKKILKKSNNRRGASVLIALVLFLLCALAGVSALTMAASNAGRYSHTDEQEYYSASSAALLFVELFHKLTYTANETATFDYERSWEYGGSGDSTDPANQHTISDKYTLTVPTAAATAPTTRTEASVSKMSGARSTLQSSKLLLLSLIQWQCDRLVPYLNIPSEWYARVSSDPAAPKRPAEVSSFTYPFTVDVKDNDTYKTVNGVLVMNDNYDLLFSFNGGDGEYAITLYWKATVSATPTTSSPTYKYAEKDASGQYTSGSVTEHSSLSVSVIWRRENVTISRGEAIS